MSEGIVYICQRGRARMEGGDRDRCFGCNLLAFNFVNIHEQARSRLEPVRYSCFFRSHTRSCRVLMGWRYQVLPAQVKHLT